jgi:BTB/POZ domain
VYARAPPSFQTRYFSFRQPLPLSTADYPDDSDSIQPRTRTPSPSPSTTTTAISQPPTTSLLRLTSSINSALFSNELEYLYTGKGFGEAFEFLFDSSESSSRDRHLRGVDDDDDHNHNDVDPEALRIDKLRKDLVYMWRSRLYSDVRIALTGNFSSSTVHGDTTTAIFSSHRFILVSRSPYFLDELLSWPSSTKQQPSSPDPPVLNLPSPPFTPASLHFTLGFMYTGTLIFSHRSYDLSTAFAIFRAALYLSLPSLQDEIQARIVQEMLHGLFHAFIPFEEYERLTNGKWGTGGCRCRQCARRVPRVLEFALADDVKNQHLERGSRRALVGLFGEGWVHQEFSSLPIKIRDSILRGLAKRTTPLNIFPLLFAAEHGLSKLGIVIEPWGDISREMILSARKTIDEVLCKESEACFNSEEWMELMEADGVKFEDGEKVEWAMAAVLRGVKDAFAASLYQVRLIFLLSLVN